MKDEGADADTWVIQREGGSAPIGVVGHKARSIFMTKLTEQERNDIPSILHSINELPDPRDEKAQPLFQRLIRFLNAGPAIDDHIPESAITPNFTGPLSWYSDEFAKYWLEEWDRYTPAERLAIWPRCSITQEPNMLMTVFQTYKFERCVPVRVHGVEQVSVEQMRQITWPIFLDNIATAIRERRVTGSINANDVEAGFLTKKQLVSEPILSIILEYSDVQGCPCPNEKALEMSDCMFCIGIGLKVGPHTKHSIGHCLIRRNRCTVCLYFLNSEGLKHQSASKCALDYTLTSCDHQRGPCSHLNRHQELPPVGDMLTPSTPSAKERAMRSLLENPKLGRVHLQPSPGEPVFLLATASGATASNSASTGAHPNHETGGTIPEGNHWEDGSQYGIGNIDLHILSELNKRSHDLSHLRPLDTKFESPIANVAYDTGCTYMFLIDIKYAQELGWLDRAAKIPRGNPQLVRSYQPLRTKVFAGGGTFQTYGQGKMHLEIPGDIILEAVVTIARTQCAEAVPILMGSAAEWTWGIVKDSRAAQKARMRGEKSATVYMHFTDAKTGKEATSNWEISEDIPLIFSELRALPLCASTPTHSLFPHPSSRTAPEPRSMVNTEEVGGKQGQSTSSSQ
uniref:Uncharacterized protein n=1 Tax=Chromera velia CCMP2878 TaxID=1169474 RepID=A0A0G4HUR3_9ALVE|eukprot:Cvel_31983.t1-p1 / transcript=Cvel_31983.t1 / gene=Cvel_31983 / organism=Chromera_velia_CCMP2878 / gene_product=hypothetical protein / transcript_product=hypothetical protein / location=Cvel_scaffold4869:1844-4003(+) / protein_length=625 / sequence_SO=supercontig / SO=protein_coding / is_pseudo=false